MNSTNRITSRNAAWASFGSLGLLACLIAAPVSAAPPQEASQSTSEAAAAATRPKKSSAKNANATPPSKARPRAVKPSTGSLDDAARRALRASSSRQRALPQGERIAVRTVAPAADPPKRRKSKGKRGKKGNARGSGGDAVDRSDRKISLDEDFLVEGRLEKPNAFFILRRSQSAYDWARLDAKFLPLVLESVQDPLF